MKNTNSGRKTRNKTAAPSQAQTPSAPVRTSTDEKEPLHYINPLRELENAVLVTVAFIEMLADSNMSYIQERDPKHGGQIASGIQSMKWFICEGLRDAQAGVFAQSAKGGPL